MKLAQALQVRSDLQNKAEDLRTRLGNNATYQEGEPTAEDPLKLIEELESVISSLETYIYRIHKTNNKTITANGSISELLAKRDALALKRSIYENFLNTASDISPRYSRTEIKTFPSVNVSELRKKSDAIAKELRELDLLIQEANWTTELL